MRSTIIATSALATLTCASPVQKRDDTSANADILVSSSLFLSGPPVARLNPAEVDASASASASLIIPAKVIPNPDSDKSPFPSPVIREDDEEDDDVEAEEGNHLEKRKAKLATHYASAAVKRHNLHRSNHGAQPVTWDAQLAAAAMKSAQRCTFAHYMNENGFRYGQNLALGYAAPNIAGIISDGWYSEVKYYGDNYGKAQPDYGTNNENFSKWGHFTQVIWRDTSRIGCATWRCKSVKTSDTDSTPMPKAYGGDVTYCNYQGPGNYGGEYANNIGRPKKTQNPSPQQGVNQTSIAKTYSKTTGQKWTV